MPEPQAVPPRHGNEWDYWIVSSDLERSRVEIHTLGALANTRTPGRSYRIESI